MAEMELQGTHEAVKNQRRGFAKTLSQDNDEQLDALARLGKLPVLKVLSMS